MWIIAKWWIYHLIPTLLYFINKSKKFINYKNFEFTQKVKEISEVDSKSLRVLQRHIQNP